MNYLHNGLNHSPIGSHSFRQAAAMDMCHAMSYLNDGTYECEIKWSRKVFAELVSIYEQQLIKRKWYQKIRKPKLGNKTLSMCKKGFLYIDRQGIAFDKTILVEVIWGYDFNYLNDYPVLRELIKEKFTEIANHIVQNYEFYATNEKVSLEKILNLYLTCLTGIYFMNVDCPAYDDQEFKITGFEGKHNEPMLFAEELISQKRGQIFTCAAEKYDEDYNKRNSRIIADTCKAIIKAMR
ncbi:hypothetical protein A7M79_19250 [Acinetobacter baumannii]|uniref:hypothetical protein n=1 Tax=Acinetobacter baumannii TaxID=470 RepID=UPI0008DD0B3C|nr:hypothetical protein [Acinetobacter baumannii]OIH01740.1 hypothetical protein A7M79_19250 [Acinetobacter baumannii]